jgi:hypothetical protein
MLYIGMRPCWAHKKAEVAITNIIATSAIYGFYAILEIKENYVCIKFIYFCRYPLQK